MNPKDRPKFALAHGGGETVVAGEPRVADALAHALATDDQPRDRLTHGFHSYPARMHWCTAERVLAALELAGARVLDPFCGSGTVLIEARVRGFSALGVDLNPLAVRLSRIKSDPLDLERRARLVALAGELRAASEARVRAREDVRARLPASELVWYEPHVLKELAGLRELIQAVEEPSLREALEMVFSSLVVKFSRQRSDSSEERLERRIRKGLASEFFERKACELAERLGELERALSSRASGIAQAAEAGAPRETRERPVSAPPHPHQAAREHPAHVPAPALHREEEPGAPRAPAPRVFAGDARWLRDLVARGAVDLVFTSPPYGGTYDYAAHHARRFAWLGIEAAALRERELGSRRRGLSARRFARELALALRSMRQVLARDGWLVLLMGDGQHGEERVAADQLVEQLAPEAELVPIAVASQTRPDFLGGPPRREHLMALRPQNR